MNRQLTLLIVCAVAVLAGCGPQAGQVSELGGIEMAYIPGGTFAMGSEGGDSDELPIHDVTLAPYYIGTREVKQKVWEEVMGVNESEFPNPEMPIMQVSWYDAVRFCNRLSDKEGLERCYDENTWEHDFSKNGFRLPTEAEWEFAAKGHGQGDQQRELFQAGEHDDEEYLGLNTTPNGFGVYDMFGTDYEWCNDWYGEHYYKHSPSENPLGPESGELRVLRGAGWYLYASFERACDRSQIPPFQKVYDLTFRVARNAD